MYCWYGHGHLKDQCPRPMGSWQSLLGPGVRLREMAKSSFSPRVHADSMCKYGCLRTIDQCEHKLAAAAPPTRCYSLRLFTHRRLLPRLANSCPSAGHDKLSEVWGLGREGGLWASPVCVFVCLLFLHSFTAPVRFLGLSHTGFGDVVVYKSVSILGFPSIFLPPVP